MAQHPVECMSDVLIGDLKRMEQLLDDLETEAVSAAGWVEGVRALTQSKIGFELAALGVLTGGQRLPPR